MSFYAGFKVKSIRHFCLLIVTAFWGDLKGAKTIIKLMHQKYNDLILLQSIFHFMAL
jgi:hypothetical protein